MDNLSVSPEALSGFAGGVNEIAERFLSAASRISGGLWLPADSSGLLATLAPSLQQFNSRIAALHQMDNTAIQQLGSGLETVGKSFEQQDETWAKAMKSVTASAPSSLDLPSINSAPSSSTRFGGLQFPDLPSIETGSLTIRNTVQSLVDMISPFDERLSGSIGVKPAEMYLVPLVGDWEHVQTIGKRIRQLAVDDHVTSENLASGSRWLGEQWLGTASKAFRTTADKLRNTMSERGTTVELIGKTMEIGGECLERLTYNQAAGLAAGLLQPKTFLNLTLPLGVWAQVSDRPMRSTIAEDIRSGIDEVKKQADSRKTAIEEILEAIRKALAYESGSTAAAPTGSLFEIPAKVPVDPGTIRYGYGNNVWWENNKAGYVAAYFDMHDWHFSSDLFGAYLGNNGADYNYILEPKYVRQIMNSADVKNTVLSQLDSIKAIAKADPQIGVTREITAPWDVNFDQDRTFTMDVEKSFKTNVDRDMRQLEEAGWARSFRVRGNTMSAYSQPMSWEGRL